MKNTIIFLFLVFICCSKSNLIFAQNRGINLSKNESKHTIFIKENQRIKIKSIDGHSIAGKFTIINDSVISIKNKNFKMDEIITIRKASTFSSILRPVSITIGGVFIIGGIALATAKTSGIYGGAAILAGVSLAIIGLPIFIVPLTVNKHSNKKWKYEIVNK